MSADVSRWPRLQLETYPVLDWVGIAYSDSRLLEIAEAVSKHPHLIQAATGTGIWNPAIEMVLRTLAASPAALKALNHRRPTPLARVVGLNRAVHFHVRDALHPRRVKAARGVVADVWGVVEGQIKNDVAQFRVTNPREYRADDAERLAKSILAEVCHRTHRPRAQVLEDFDADMRYRASTST